MALTPRPRLAGVLGFANLFQTIPSLALFGFLIPIPYIGGIGARTAIVALILYALLPSSAAPRRLELDRSHGREAAIGPWA